MIEEFVVSALAVKWSMFEIETDKRTPIVERQGLLYLRFEKQIYPVALLNKIVAFLENRQWDKLP